jgi:hypothetical protein
VGERGADRQFRVSHSKPFGDVLRFYAAHLSEMRPQDRHNNTQQDESDKAPKYPPPRLMTAAIDRRFFGLPVHQASVTSVATKPRIALILRAADGGLSDSWSRGL